MNTREVGAVRWFNNSKGFGYIQRDSDKKDLFVHFRNIRGKEKEFRSLQEGLNVTFLIKRNEKDQEIADDVVVFDPIKEAAAKQARLAILLGLFKSTGAESQLQQSFSRKPIFEKNLIPMVFEFADVSPKK